ncbi:MAG: hypothetical protein ACHBN1_11070 [Heteroscytonema crispum UTEX LB 1556]|mgnify:CR=1 FL=1
MRIWVATLTLACCWLTSVAIASFAVSCLAENSTSSSSQSVSAKAIAVAKAEFGVVRVDSKGKVILIPTSTVPLQEGNKYGWRIRLKDYKGVVTWREVLRLPKLPQTWSTVHGEDFSISATGTAGETTRTEYTPNGVIENFWTITSGDPIGKHRIEVYVNNHSIANFGFEVVAVKK